MPLGLYLHIPFCQAICNYCNFNRGLLDEPLKARYVEALACEITAAACEAPADTVFLGGGTPSLLSPHEVARLLAACRESFALSPDAEITLETNPETVTQSRLEAFRDAGVTRLSFGVQSFDDEQLARLDRLHSADKARQAVRDARRAGVSQVSLDLMFWLPGQSRAAWRRTVDEAVRLEPDHLSMYLLELYPNAPLKEAMARASGSDADAWLQAADDEAADMYLEALEVLDEAGLVQYEISNVARAGCESRHNVKYWQGGDWRGFGCGAHSTVEAERWQNVAGTEDYVTRVGEGREVAIGRHRLRPEDQVAEALFTGLRLTAGIDEGNFCARFGVDPWSRHEDALAPLVDDGLVWRRHGAFGLTRRGMLVANEILTIFV